MITCVLALLMAAKLALPLEPDAWPLDDAVVKSVDLWSGAHGGLERNLRDAVVFEQGNILRAKVVLVGVCIGDGPTGSTERGPWVTSIFRTERCLYGDCPDTVLLRRTLNYSGWHINMPLGTRRLDWSGPEIGSRYLVLADRSTEDAEALWGGFGHGRYEFSEGMVVGKRVSEREFLSAVEKLLAAASDAAGSYRQPEDGVVQPPN